MVMPDLLSKFLAHRGDFPCRAMKQRLSYAPSVIGVVGGCARRLCGALQFSCSHLAYSIVLHDDVVDG